MTKFLIWFFIIISLILVLDRFNLKNELLTFKEYSQRLKIQNRKINELFTETQKQLDKSLTVDKSSELYRDLQFQKDIVNGLCLLSEQVDIQNVKNQKVKDVIKASEKICNERFK